MDVCLAKASNSPYRARPPLETYLSGNKDVRPLLALALFCFASGFRLVTSLTASQRENQFVSIGN